MKHAYHLFTIQLKLDQLKVNRDFILGALQSEGIGVGIHYKAIHQHSAYVKKFGYTDNDFPNASWLSERTISLPIGSNLTEQDTDDVIEAVRKVLGYYKR
jgi:dTDP-4-amino-4,6-dideoxygalactose transaminase